MPAPRPILRGIDDRSTRQLPFENTPISQHTPFLLLMTKRGPVEPRLINYSEFSVLYDMESLNAQSRYYTHQSELASIAIEEGNSTIMVKRIVDSSTATAGLTVGVDIAGNRVKLDDYGVETTTAIPNYYAPLFSMKAVYPGAWGNYYGVEIFKADEKLQSTMGSVLDCMVYYVVVYREDEVTGKRYAVDNLFGETLTPFVTRPESIYNGINYYFDDVMKYFYIEPEGVLTREEIFEGFTLHTDGLAVLAGREDFWKVDVLSGLGASKGSGFRKGLPFFMRGGNDGFEDRSPSDIVNRLDIAYRYETAVYNYLSSINEASPILDMGKYPFTTLWDSGFVRRTKLAFSNLMRLRKDIWIAVSVTSANKETLHGSDIVFDWSDKLSNQELISLASYYRTYFGNVIESDLYGTPTVRCVLLGQDGLNLTSQNRRRQSIATDLFRKVSRYCGSPDSKWNPSRSFDVEGNNLLQNWTNLSLDYMSPAVADDAWDTGIIYVQSKDIKNKFYPMYQTIYPHDTSVLNSIFVMMACCWIQKIHFRSWVHVTGNARLTDTEFMEKLDTFINGQLQGAFDGRFITQSRTYLTKSDEFNGFSYTTETTLYSEVTKTTATYKIIAHRMSDFNG